MKAVIFSKRFYWAFLCFALFFLMVALGLSHSGIIGYGEQSAKQTLLNEWQAPELPDLELVSIEGKRFKLRELNRQGKLGSKAIIINFWASWCAPCIREFPVLIDAALSDNQAKTILVAISNDREEANMQNFLRMFPDAQDNHDNIFIVWDPNLEISQKYFNVVILPETFIINQDNRIVHKIVGELNKEELVQKISSINN